MIKLFGAKIKHKRKKLKITLEQLANLTNSSKSYIWEIEKKENANPSVILAYSLSKALNLSMDYLLDDTISIGESVSKKRIIIAEESDGIGKVLFSYDLY